MSHKPERLDQIWSEKDLCARLDLPIGKHGHSRQLGNWIKGGLKYCEKAGRRYFFEEDVIDYIWSRYWKPSEADSQDTL